MTYKYEERNEENANGKECCILLTSSRTPVR